jgi:hypothetical protein
MTPDPSDPLTALGHVDPPPPEVLRAARETLWSAVTQEMLTATPSPQAATPRAAAADSQGLDGTLDPLEGDRWHIGL